MADFIDRVSTLDAGYQTGDLSIFPESIDSTDQLYIARNNAETVLIQTIGYTSRFIVVSDTSSFPDKGIIRLGQELIYYQEKTSAQFRQLKRGYAGSRQGQWNAGTKVTNVVAAEPHNAIKDALINIEKNLGVETNPVATSLNGLLKSLENKFLAPKPIFRSYPTSGVPPLTVTFQNFSGSDPIRYLWDFGDGSQSIETAPTHTYLSEGIYTVKLNMITSLGAQGVTVKSDYITVGDDLGPQFFYVTPLVGTTSTTFNFVDQTEGEIINRYWVFDDGEKEVDDDPDVHFTSHTYAQAGTYSPTLIVVLKSQKVISLNLPDPIIVS